MSENFGAAREEREEVKVLSPLCVFFLPPILSLSLSPSRRSVTAAPFEEFSSVIRIAAETEARKDRIFLFLHPLPETLLHRPLSGGGSD